MAHLLAVIISEISVEHLALSKWSSIMFLNFLSKFTSSGDQIVAAYLVAEVFLELYIKPLALSKQPASIVLKHLVKIHST